jgi:hypothetical protein
MFSKLTFSKGQGKTAASAVGHNSRKAKRSSRSILQLNAAKQDISSLVEKIKKAPNQQTAPF